MTLKYANKSGKPLLHIYATRKGDRLKVGGRVWVV